MHPVSPISVRDERVERASARPSDVVATIRRIPWVHAVVLALPLAIAAWLLVENARGGRTSTPEVALLLLSLPYVFLNVAGLLTPTRAYLRMETGERSLATLYLCIVTKGSNREAVRRSYAAMKPLEGARVRIRIVSDHPLDVPHLLVPESFRPRFAKHKARALEWFRIHTRFRDDDWILHLDEESVIDRPGLEACLEFIRRSGAWYGQGAILYDNHDFWRHPVVAAADCIRVTDDLGKFHFQYAVLRKPILGLHGSFLLVNGRLENEITWDVHGSLVEDYAFAIECMKRGYACDEVHGVVREQSPHSVMDFLRQRRRWLVGIRGLSRLSPWARAWSMLWSLSPLVKASVVLLVVTRSPASSLVMTSGMVLTAAYLYFYVLGSVVQDLDRGVGVATTVRHATLTLLLFPASVVLETLPVLWSFFSRERAIGFQVVRK